MFSQMSGRRLAVQSSGEVPLDAMLKTGVRADPDVAALAAIDGDKLTILIWHYHDDDVAGPDAAITLDLSGMTSGAGKATLHHFRVDREHSNAFEAWKKIGSPANPSPEQYRSLERTSQLTEIEAPRDVQIEDGKLSLKLTLPRQAVSLLRLDLPPKRL
jgi:xylan 1,4-beta-xylosidase